MFDDIALLKDLPSGSLKILEMFCQIKEFQKWDILIKKWSRSQSMYVLKYWLLEAYDDTWILWQILPWEVVWEMALYEKDNIRSASVRAIEDSMAIELQNFSIETILMKHPKIFEELKTTIALRKLENWD